MYALNKNKDESKYAKVLLCFNVKQKMKFEDLYLNACFLLGNMRYLFTNLTVCVCLIHGKADCRASIVVKIQMKMPTSISALICLILTRG